MKTRKVTVVPYDPQWPQAFAAIRQQVEAVLGEGILGIHHVGSTSVPGLSAKPIIDLDVEIRDMSVFDVVRDGLAAIGYEHEGDLGIPGREAFRYEGKEHLMKHHLYVCPADSMELKRHLTFRDYLRTHPEAVEAYSQIKEEAVRLFPEDIDGYIAHKGAYIAGIYSLCGL